MIKAKLESKASFIATPLRGYFGALLEQRHRQPLPALPYERASRNPQLQRAIEYWRSQKGVTHTYKGCCRRVQYPCLFWSLQSLKPAAAAAPATASLKPKNCRALLCRSIP